MGIGEILVLLILALVLFGPEKTMIFVQQALVVIKKIRTLWHELSETGLPKQGPPHEQ